MSKLIEGGDWGMTDYEDVTAPTVYPVHAYKRYPFSEWQLGETKKFCFQKHSCFSMEELNRDLHDKNYTKKDHIKKIFPQYFI